MYTIIDLIDKLAEIDKEQYELYLRISQYIKFEARLQVMSKVFSNQEKKHLIMFEELKKISSTYDDIEIEFGTYDRAVELIYEFSKIKTKNHINNVEELFNAALIFEKENLALVIIIIGLFVKLHNHVETRNYIILSQIMKEEQSHVNLIQDILEPNSIN
ncbi:hypothetical protein LGL08_01335 [Clostridium estertheticum]|uniref:hypothetical protein n=1 Tax=Clostridium estertheticum TaxID=238834 RepID=UPI001CF1E4B2|nr:hypothetical protein [Clostridium estertheticum]MCB2307243.1 hypothetical protein [Clostridium estertheticum]MCB2344171.1 hypothetical protein [Clostridium estertheticum]MCB2348215.1 hypothetical protein [Clostridium estertheticum]WAG45851.1 hypothetical protein LL127_20430 [Clostridium estertheticum]